MNIFDASVQVNILRNTVYAYYNCYIHGYIFIEIEIEYLLKETANIFLILCMFMAILGYTWKMSLMSLCILLNYLNEVLELCKYRCP